jgi:hypothetical protein
MGRAALSQAVDLETTPDAVAQRILQMAECGFVIAGAGRPTAPNPAFVIFVFVLSLLVPTVISTAICYSVASTDEGPARPVT